MEKNLATSRDQRSWLLLLFSLPATHKTARVAIWRKLQKSGAIAIKTSTYLLPDTPAHYELFQWLAKQVTDYGGDSTLIRAQQIEGLSDARIVGLFNAARDSDYAALSDAARKLAAPRAAKRDKAFADELEKLRKTFRAIREIDFFDAPKAHVTEAQLDRLESAGRSKTPPAARLQAAKFQGRIWVTRPRPQIDRVACAWLIRGFIDSKATFKFAANADSIAGAIPFDYAHGEFSHHGEDCTFETLLARFALADKALRKIGEMVHDADLEDEKFQRPECLGLDRILKGWAKRGLPDEEILSQGAGCFDGLYAFLRRL
ncbi:MAG TPA: chromate resistance protein ChrB domain-containing protein [Chthoniobacterales bacterium]